MYEGNCYNERGIFHHEGGNYYQQRREDKDEGGSMPDKLLQNTGNLKYPVI